MPPTLIGEVTQENKKNRLKALRTAMRGLKPILKAKEKIYYRMADDLDIDFWERMRLATNASQGTIDYYDSLRNIIRLCQDEYLLALTQQQDAEHLYGMTLYQFNMYEDDLTDDDAPEESTDEDEPYEYEEVDDAEEVDEVK